MQIGGVESSVRMTQLMISQTIEHFGSRRSYRGESNHHHQKTIRKTTK